MSRKAAGRIYNFLHFNPPDGIYFSSGMKIRIKGPIGLSSAAKFILFAVAAVLVPTLILSVVQYRSLSDLQVKTEAAVEENLRRTLQSIARRVEDTFRAMAGDALANAQPSGFSESELKKK